MKYNSPLMKFLETIANMLIVSLFWIVSSILIVTIIPASAALYHTVNKVIFNGRGNGVAKDYFNSFKTNFVLGTKVNMLCIVAIAFIVIGLNTGLQIYTLNIFGLLYLILGFLITFIFAVIIVFLPAVISKFYLKVHDVFRLSIIFAFENIFISILNVLLLAFFIIVVRVIPLTIVIIPALYIDLIKTSIEKKMQNFIKNNNLNEIVSKKDDIQKINEEISSFEINDSLSKDRRTR